MENDDFSFKVIFDAAVSLSLMIGGIVPFIPQYRDIKKLENADGFSLHVCFVLLIANSLRILFWFGHPFELPLLIQSIVAIWGMFMLIHLCVKVKNKSAIIKGREHHFYDFDLQYFWAWTDFMSYVEFMATFSAFVGLAVFIMLDVTWFVELIGFLALFIEATLGVPQFYKNYSTRSTEGMNKLMVGMWTSGDVFKTFIFISRSAPFQFPLCGSLQVMVDVGIFFQIWLYSSQSAIMKTKTSQQTEVKQDSA